MGYELHIVRFENWDDDEAESNITLEEWLDYVKTDNELELTNGYYDYLPTGDVFIESPGFCYWNGLPDKQGEFRPWFDYSYGMISVKYPEDETIKKILEIAKKLNVRVQSGDGDYFDESYFLNKETLNETPIISTIKKPWWKFW